MAHSVYLFIN